MNEKLTDTKLSQKYEIEEIDLSSVEELETAIAPGGLGIFCGCGGGNFGIWCG